MDTTSQTSEHGDLAVDRAYPVHPVNEAPTALRGEVWLTLQTRYAQRLFMGRSAEAGKASIIGLTRFGRLVAQLQICSAMDDPYADWWMMKIEDELDRAQNEMATLTQVVERQRQSTPAMQIAIAESLQPLRVPLKFRNAYAYWAARVLADFDLLARSVLTVRHVGLLDRRQSERTLHLGAKAFRRALGTVHGYRCTGVKRQDILERTAKSQVAQEQMGELPVDVLQNTRCTRYAPIHVKPKPRAKFPPTWCKMDNAEGEPVNSSDDIDTVQTVETR